MKLIDEIFDYWIEKEKEKPTEELKLILSNSLYQKINQEIKKDPLKFRDNYMNCVGELCQKAGLV